MENKEALRKSYSNDYCNSPTHQLKTRSSSGLFTQLTSTQVNEFKESFALLDKDGNGIISKEDLEAMLVSLGQNPTSSDLSYMLSLIPSPLNFAAYLTFFSTYLSEISPREEIMKAFQTFDEDNSGKVNFYDLKDALMTMGSRMSEHQVDNALKKFVNGNFVQYQDLVDALAGSEEKNF
ncbi:hypothetical protein PNEG_03314 [Pneumocystis murina B123]|uniref:EF-hand domain-containing protein n=1 Tax=Pneumocystis murina (strain B123) TaxID=1069680 RepID=M7NIR2_PNEMU|nr:hypothetical protein PNEG_03314 [Pneumocystis murina B123]EMR08488.1 hypothetical protein PNEG_03314 [Pneumocystis murina B123]